MNKRDELLNELLKSNSIVSGRDLAVKLSVSRKSVTNYINEINCNEEIIFSSKDGYWVDKEKAKKYKNENYYLPQDYDERAKFIIQKLLSNHNEKINVYKLCDELFVSYSTLKNDISKMNAQYRNFDIKFILRNNYLQMDGKEKCKRKLMSKIIYDQNKNILNIKLLEDSFPEVKVSLLVEIINNTLKKYNYYLNDFARMNLIIHYSIIIERMTNGHNIQLNEYCDLSDLNSIEKAMIDYLKEELENNFNLALSKDDIYEFLIILRTNAQKTEVGQTNLFKEHIDNKIICYVDNLITKLKDMYYLDLCDDQFIVPFTLHLNNLYERVRHNSTIKNPMAEQLKNSSPILYDIALFIAKDFCEYFNLDNNLSVDEIGFLTIHVGSKIERDNNGEEKLNVILVCPNYIHLAVSIRNKLLYNLGTKIDIVNTVNEFNESKFKQYDIVITTMKIETSNCLPIVEISPFVSDSDISNIYESITMVKKQKNILILKNNYLDYFSEQNFILVDEQFTKNEVIHMMTEKLIENGYVNKDYEEKVLIRENSSPTSFYNFAIPHSFEMDAKISGICVLISKNEIQWDYESVNIVLLIAMSKKDNMYFYQLYEAIINLLTDDRLNEMLKNIRSFNEFKTIINQY